MTTSAVEIKIKNQNKTVNLINEGEINILKSAGLSEVSFQVLLPNQQYPFAVYESGFSAAQTYLDKFESLKVSQMPFQWIVTREFPSGGQIFNTNMKVSLESYTIKENTDYGFDIVAEVNLKQYKEYGTKVCTVETTATGTSISVENVRETTTSPMPQTTESYTVKSGDTLWAIAKYYCSPIKYYQKRLLYGEQATEGRLS
ncbi:MAG: LysM peptidoglycan-binding domain-containing protein [Bacillota bacterium]